MAAKRRQKKAPARRSAPRRPKDPPDQIVLGLGLGIGLFFWHLGRVLFKAIYYLTWFDPNDAKVKETKENAQKPKRKAA